jgi:hypothetical protein
MSRHYDARTLAAYREGLLRRGRRERIGAHLATCQHCAAVEADLAGVTAALAAVPQPPMPPAIAERLEVALAAQAGLAVGASSREDDQAVLARPGGDQRGSRWAPGGPAETPAHGRGARPAQRRPRWARPAAVAAAVAALLAGGGYAVSQFPLGTGPASTAAGSSPRKGTAGQPAHAPNGTLPAFGVNIPTLASGTNYQPATLGKQAAAVLAHDVDRPALPSANGLHKPASNASAVAISLRGCLGRVAPGESVSMVDFARYRGLPATIIVVSNGRQRTVLVVGRGCSAHSGQVIARAPVAGPG